MITFNVNNKCPGGLAEWLIDDEDLEFYNRGQSEDSPNYWDKEDILYFEMYVYYEYD